MQNSNHGLLLRKFFLRLFKIPQYVLCTGIKVYAYLISPFFPSSCRFYPTCSSYAYEALHTFGSIKGSLLTMKRLGKCHPWGGHGIDCVPKHKRFKF